MITTLKKYETNFIEDPLGIHQDISGFYFERKMMILESNWDTENMFNSISVFPFLSNISTFLSNKQQIKVGYRHFDSVRGLRYYTRFPEGKLFTDQNYFGSQVLNIAAHGGSTSLLPTLDIIRKDGLMDAFKGFDSYPNIIFFSGCGIFHGEQGENFGQDILGSSGTLGVFGYSSTDVGFLESTIVNLAFLTRFYAITDGNPFDRLEEIFNSVLENFKPARDLGFTMFLK